MKLRVSNDFFVLGGILPFLSRAMSVVSWPNFKDYKGAKSKFLRRENISRSWVLQSIILSHIKALKKKKYMQIFKKGSIESNLTG